MLACVDVDYRGDEAVAACVLFGAWSDGAAAGCVVEKVSGVEPYVPGQFYRRELPCLLAVLGKLPERPELVVIDGYVWLGGEDRPRPGLGGHLFEALERKVPVVGVAKTRFHSARLAVPVVHGEGSTRPLFVTAAGIEAATAAAHVQAMHGTYRLPTLLRLVDQLCRQS
jgi:deoxyribonuclease V